MLFSLQFVAFAYNSNSTLFHYLFPIFPLSLHWDENVQELLSRYLFWTGELGGKVSNLSSFCLKNSIRELTLLVVWMCSLCHKHYYILHI